MFWTSAPQHLLMECIVCFHRGGTSAYPPTQSSCNKNVSLSGAIGFLILDFLPVVMIVEQLCSQKCPHIAEQANHFMHSTKGMGSKDCHSFPTAEIKLVLEKLHSLASIANSIGMALVFGRFVQFVTKLCAVFTSSCKLEAPWQDDLKQLTFVALSGIAIDLICHRLTLQ